MEHELAVPTEGDRSYQGGRDSSSCSNRRKNRLKAVKPTSGCVARCNLNSLSPISKMERTAESEMT